MERWQKSKRRKLLRLERTRYIEEGGAPKGDNPVLFFIYKDAKFWDDKIMKLKDGYEILFIRNTFSE